MREIHAAKSLGFDLLYDPDGQVAAEYGLQFTMPADLQGVYASFGLDVPTFNGDGQWRLPMPARYIVDQDGRIVYASVHPDYTTRPEPEDTLKALRHLDG